MHIDRYTLTRVSGDKNRVLVDLIQNGVRNQEATNFFMASSSGYETYLGNLRGYEEIEFPAIIKITYNTWNKLKTSQYQASFEIEIFEPGDWRLELHN